MERRSSRQKKKINYHEYAGGIDSEDSEDDFASGPPVKRAKAERIAPKKKQQQVLSNAETPQDVPKGRLSREEKQFSRELHQAIAASIHDTDQPGSLQSSPADIKNEKENDSDFCLEDEGAGDESSSCSLSESGKDSDFEASPPPKGKGAKSEQKKMTKNKKTTEKTVKPAVTKGKSKKAAGSLPGTPGPTKPLTPVATKAATPVTSKPLTPVATKAVTPMAAKPGGSGDLEATSKSCLPGSRQTPGLGVRRMPKWTPPARVGGENGATACAKTFSPSSSSGGPVIRVGLSRNVRVKPLHAKVSIQNT